MAQSPKDPLDHEPEAVEYARRKAGYSVTEAARELGVAVSLISQIESGKRNATPAMLLKMAQAYNCPLVVMERKRYAREPAAASEEDGAAKAAKAA